jgi:lysophospholipase L1-like esterase
MVQIQQLARQWLFPDLPLVCAGQNVVFVGDSLTEGIGGSPLSNGIGGNYVNQLMLLPGWQGLGTFWNTGEAGWSISNLISDYPTHVAPEMPTATGLPATTCLCIGANDLPSTTGSAEYAAVLPYIATLHAAGSRVVWITVPEMPGFNGTTWNTNRLAYNALILSDTNADQHVNLGVSALETSSTTTSYYNNSGAAVGHPTVTGYGLWANTMASQVSLPSLENETAVFHASMPRSTTLTGTLSGGAATVISPGLLTCACPTLTMTGTAAGAFSPSVSVSGSTATITSGSSDNRGFVLKLDY